MSVNAENVGLQAETSCCRSGFLANSGENSTYLKINQTVGKLSSPSSIILGSRKTNIHLHVLFISDTVIIIIIIIMIIILS